MTSVTVIAAFCAVLAIFLYSRLLHRKKAGSPSIISREGKHMNPKTLKYILKRIVLAIFTVWVVITVTFFIMHAVPGGPFVGEKAVSPAVQKAMEAKFGLDKPLMEQYLTYLTDVIHF